MNQPTASTAHLAAGGSTTREPRSARLSPALAGIASAAMAGLGAWWASGGTGYPFGRAADPGAAVSALGDVAPAVGAVAMTGLGVAGVIAAAVMALRVGRTWVRRLALAWGIVAAATLLLVIPDYRVLSLVAYTPLYVLGAPLDWPPGGSLLDALTPPIVSQGLAMAVGSLWAVATLGYARATSGSCLACGRADQESHWTHPASAARWGRWATAVAVAVPLVYAATRWAWALGIPLGITDELLHWGAGQGLWIAGAGLATVAAAGAVLTLGLVLPFGERFPRWVPLIGARAVPVRLAVVPALIVAALVTSAGLMFVRLAITGGFAEVFGFIGAPSENLAALAPELLWPVWGVALALAAVAYRLRRRGTCTTCGRR